MPEALVKSWAHQLNDHGPSQARGSRYERKKEYSGNEVYFALQDGQFHYAYSSASPNVKGYVPNQPGTFSIGPAVTGPWEYNGGAGGSAPNSHFNSRKSGNYSWSLAWQGWSISARLLDLQTLS